MLKIWLLSFFILICGLTREVFAQLPAFPKNPEMPRLDRSLFHQYFKKGVCLSSFSVESSGIYSHGLFSNDLLTTSNFYQARLRLNAGVDVAGIPLIALYSRNESSPRLMDLSQKNWFQLQMDVEAYRDKWKKLATELGPGAITKSGKQLHSLKQNFARELAPSARQKARSEATSFFDSVSAQIDPLAMNGKTPDEIANNLFGQDIKKLLAEARTELDRAKAEESEKLMKDSVLQAMQSRVSELEEKLHYVERISNLVKDAEAAGLLKEMKDLESRSMAEFDQLMQNPDALIRRLCEQYNIGGAGKIISLLSQLRLGGQSLPNSAGTIPFLTKGISFELNLGNKFLGFSTGKIVPVDNDLLLNPANGTASDMYMKDKPSYWFLHYRQGRMQEAHKGFRLTGISGHDNNDMQMQPVSFLNRKKLLVDVYSKERLFGDTWLNVEVSKSIASGTQPKQNIFNLDNASFKINIDGKDEPSGIYHQLYFNKTTGAYSNFSQSYLSLGGYEAGFSFRKKKPKSKITSSIRGRVRNFSTPGTADSKWRSANLRGRIHYKLKKSQTIQVNANWHEGYKQYDLGSVQRIIRQQSRGLSGDLNTVNKRIFGLYNTSFFSAGVQQDIFPVTGIPGKSVVRSNAYNILWNQVFLKGEDILQFNAVFTKVSQSIDEYLYNTKLDIDGGAVFRMSDKLSLGASLVFGYFRGAYTNIGIRPSLSGTVFKNFNIEFSSDVRKNIKLVNPLFDQFFSLDCAIRYTIK